MQTPYFTFQVSKLIICFLLKTLLGGLYLIILVLKYFVSADRLPQDALYEAVVVFKHLLTFLQALRVTLKGSLKSAHHEVCLPLDRLHLLPHPLHTKHPPQHMLNKTQRQGRWS